MKIYATIQGGPPEVKDLMYEIGLHLGQSGYHLRTWVFDQDAYPFARASFTKNIPFESFGHRESVAQDWAIDIAKDITLEVPFERMIPDIQKKLLERIYQIYGDDGNSPAEFLILFSDVLDPCSSEAPYLRFSARAAKKKGIPVYNLAIPEVKNKFASRLQELKASKKRYAGIGSRSTPEDIQKLMRLFGADLATLGYTLRSGGAAGADTAFEEGARSKNGSLEIWNPRKQSVREHPWAVKLASKVSQEYPLNKMKPFVRNLIVRNMYQILGEDGKSPVEFVVLWTPLVDPCDKDCGGTRYAARVAKLYNIPIYNLRDPEAHRLLLERMEKAS